MRFECARGYTLIEMLLVVGLLSIVAAIAVPSLNDNDELLLDRGAAEVARAIRFAQSEAVRKNQSYGITGSTFSQSIRVYRVNTSGQPVFDVYDPLTKQLYDLRFGTGALEPSIDRVYFKFIDSATPLPFVRFSVNTGVPFYTSFGTTHMLENGYFELGHGGMTRTIVVSPMTGRVTVQ